MSDPAFLSFIRLPFMNVLALTIFVGGVLAGLFTLLWLWQALSARPFDEREALLPLENEMTSSSPEASPLDPHYKP